jgi:hypothetical protein
VVPATQKAEAGGLLETRNLGAAWATFRRPCLFKKEKRKKKKREEGRREGGKEGAREGGRKKVTFMNVISYS